MEGEAFVRLEKLLGRELEQSEKERLQRIQDVLKIGPNDALWSIIAALEYQRAYYEELPQKIRTATEEILAEWSEAARKNAAAPQKTKLKKAGEQTNVISLKELVQPWFTWALFTFCLLLLYGSLSMWAGYSIGSGHTQPSGLLMRMPVGILMGLLCMSVCVRGFARQKPLPTLTAHGANTRLQRRLCSCQAHGASAWPCSEKRVTCIEYS